MLSGLFKLLLKVMGWRPLSSDQLNLMTQHQYTVCVFSHTSFYDFLLMVLYYMSHDELKNLKTLISPHYYYEPFKYIGGIKAASIYSKNAGQLTHIVDQIKSCLTAQFLISPKGSILKKEWRTGYYYIAKQLNAPICCLGMDYEQKEVRIGQFIDNNLEEKEIRQLLYKDLSQIVPLYPEREVVNIREYNKDNVSLMSRKRLIIYLLQIIILHHLIF